MRTVPRFLSWAVVVMLAGGLIACSSSDPAAPLDDPTAVAARATIANRKPDIAGTITRVARGSNTTDVAPGADAVLARVLIEERPDQRSGDEKAVVDVTRRTRIFRRDRAGLHPATIADLEVGSIAHAWFTGPVRESYPVQATGAAIVVH
jgi:hypothetical protein